MGFKVSVRNKIAKVTVWSQIVAQFLLPLISIVPARASEPIPVQDSDYLPYSQTLGSVARSLSDNGTDGLKSTATNMATGKASSTVEEWLNQFGTARVNLNVDNDGNWDQSSIDLLTPLYDNKESIWFTQFGLRAPDGRVTGNFGTGVRTFFLPNWMFGGNVFFDDDFTGKNRRVGIGAEAWTNYLKFSANSYLGTTDWHSSRDFNEYNEKPADGFDIRAEGYLPAYPQLGAKVMYEKYHGDNVALFDTDHLQHNPSAVTMEVKYTPVPLVTLSANYRRGQDSLDDAQLQLDLHYEIGQSLQSQLDPANVRDMRTLAGSRYDLVERNNQIVMQYQKKEKRGVTKLMIESVTDNSAADGVSQNTVQVVAMDGNNEPVANAPIIWSSTGTAKIESPTGVTNSQGVSTVNLTNTLPETVQLSAKSGTVSATTDSHFHAVTVSHVTMTVTKDGSVADGETANSATAIITDINNRPIANSKVEWSVSSPAVLKNMQTMTDANGKVNTQFTSTEAGSVTVKVKADTLTAEQQSHFVSNAANAEIADFDVTTNNSPANGSTPNIAIVTVKDNNGNAVANTSVAVNADKPTVSFSSFLVGRKATSHQTDENGQLRIAFTDTVAEAVTLTARLDNGSTKTASAQFAPDAASAQLKNLTITQDNGLADGSAANAAEVFVSDTNGNALAGVTVNWSADKPTVRFNAESVTDASGKATTRFTDTHAETVTVKAQLSNGNNLTAQSTFTADINAAQLQDLLVSKDGSKANGTDANAAEVYVKDAAGNPIADQEVTWKSDKAGVTFVPSGKTDGYGKATVNFTSTVAQDIQLSAQLQNGETLSAPSLFVADTDNEQIASFTVTTGAIANGSAANTAVVTVTDSNDNPVKDATVSWGQSGSATLSAQSGTTNASGKATIALTDLKAENVDVTVKLDAGPSQTKSMQFIADADTAKIADFTVTTGAIADGQAANSGTITVVDANNNPVNGAQVAWGTSTETSKTSASAMTTDDTGKASVAVTDTTAEKVTLTANVNGDSQAKEMAFVSDASNAEINTLTIDVDNSVANGTAQNKATAIVVDSNGNPVPDQAITWTVNKATVVITPLGKTDVNGKASVVFTDTAVEKSILTAQLSNGNRKSVRSQFQADSETATVAEVVIDPNNSPADGITSNIATATIVDVNGNPVPGETVTWSADRSSVVLSQSEETDKNGKTFVSFTDTVGGKVNITAKLSNGNTLAKEANFLSQNVTSLTPDMTTQNANGKDAITFTAKLTDSAAQPVANAGVVFSLTGNATLSDTEVNTDSNGLAQITVTSQTEGEVTVTAKSKTNTADTGKSSTVAFTANHITRLTANGYDFDADSGFPTTGFTGANFQAFIDNSNNGDYTWSTDKPWATVDNNGKVTFSGTPGASNNTVTLKAVPKDGGATQTYTFTIRRWFVSTGQTSNQSAPDGICSAQGMSVPSYTVLSNAAIGEYGTRGAIGTLFGEWGSMGAYPSWAKPSPKHDMWAAEMGSSTRVYMTWSNGYLYDNAGNNAFDVTCTRAL